tara:strand:- start:1302 stop:1460 length:159 start_codon:yes stop_codon:yes gene_type:complete
MIQWIKCKLGKHKYYYCPGLGCYECQCGAYIRPEQITKMKEAGLDTEKKRIW